MNEELTRLIEEARRAGSDIASFIQQQAPELAGEIVRRQVVVSATFLGISALFVFIFVAIFFWRASKNDDDGSFFALIAGLIVCAPALINLWNLITAITAPRLVVLQEIAALLK